MSGILSPVLYLESVCSLMFVCSARSFCRMPDEPSASVKRAENCSQSTFFSCIVINRAVK